MRARYRTDRSAKPAVYLRTLGSECQTELDSPACVGPPLAVRFYRELERILPPYFPIGSTLLEDFVLHNGAYF